MKLVIKLSRPMPASEDCLPHAAMTLGSPRGLGSRPAASLVSRLVIQSQLGAWCLLRFDDGGGFIGDSTHPSRADALRTARREFALADADVDAAVASADGDDPSDSGGGADGGGDVG
jgi:hypothetical protein